MFNTFWHKGTKHIALFTFVFENFDNCLSYSELSNWRIWIRCPFMASRFSAIGDL